MKKIGLVCTVLFFIVLTGCEYRTCPTYTRKPAYMEKIPQDQRVNSVQGEQTNV